MVRDEMLDRFRSMRDEFKRIAPYRMDQRPRSQSELDLLFDRLNALPPTIRQATMVQMADKAGHMEGEKQPCELCQFLANQVQRKNAMG